MPTPLQMFLLKSQGRDGMPRGAYQGTPSPASGSISNASNLARGGLVASMLTGIPGLGLAGAGIGTARDVSNFAGPYGAPTFRGSGMEHFADAATGGMFGENLQDQAITSAAQINPTVNPADVFSGQKLDAPISRPVADRGRGGLSSRNPRGGDFGRAGGGGGFHW